MLVLFGSSDTVSFGDGHLSYESFATMAYMENRSTDDTSFTLLQRVKVNDQDAWQTLVQLYSPLVYHWCVVDAQLSAEDGADVMQVVFRSVAKSISKFHRDREGDTFRGWLRVITRNRIRNFLRDNARHPTPTGGPWQQLKLEQVPAPAQDESDAIEQGLIIRQALVLMKENFHESTWRAFWLLVVDQLTTEEIAQQLDTTVQAVRQSCYRVRRRLRVELAGLLD